MEFTTLPPEVISALIHSGPGAESLANAAAAWQQLSANLEDAADNYAASLSSMDETWYGPSSAAMVQSVTPYVTWLRTTAQQTQQTAAAAQSAAAAFNSVQAAVVPTATVAANRMRLAQLLATNVFGRNLPAIAQTESEYQTMWANNSAAMTRYQAASSQASTLPQLTSPTSATNPSGLTTQASAASRPLPLPRPLGHRGHTATAGPLRPELPCLIDLAADRDSYVGLANAYCQPVLLVRIPDQPAQLSGAEPIGPGIAGCEQPKSARVSRRARGRWVGPRQIWVGVPPERWGRWARAGAVWARWAPPDSAKINTSAALGAAVPMGNLSAPPSAAPLLATPVQLASAATPLGAGGAAGMPMPPLMPPPISPGSGWRKRKAQKYEDIAIGAELKGKVMKPPPSAG